MHGVAGKAIPAIVIDTIFLREDGCVRNDVFERALALVQRSAQRRGRTVVPKLEKFPDIFFRDFKIMRGKENERIIARRGRVSVEMVELLFQLGQTAQCFDRPCGKTRITGEAFVA